MTPHTPPRKALEELGFLETLEPGGLGPLREAALAADAAVVAGSEFWAPVGLMGRAGPSEPELGQES